MSHPASESPPATESLPAQLRRMTGINAACCYQCGKCTAGCPMAGEMHHKTHQILRLVQLDQRQRLLGDESIWLCLTCETCSARCPNQVEPARVIDALREITTAANAAAAPRRIRAFHQSFLDQVETHGRVFEFGLVAQYKMKTGRLFDDVAAAPGMLARGKLALMPRTIADIADIRRIFAACRAVVEE